MSPVRLYRIDKTCHHYRALLNTMGTTEAPAPGTPRNPSWFQVGHTATPKASWALPGVLQGWLMLSWPTAPALGKWTLIRATSAGLASCSRHYRGIEKIKNPVSALLKVSCKILGKSSNLSLSQHANIQFFSQVQDSHAHHKYFQALLAAATWSPVQLNSSGFLDVHGTDTLYRPLPEMEILFPLLHYTAKSPSHQRVLETEDISAHST